MITDHKSSAIRIRKYDQSPFFRYPLWVMLFTHAAALVLPLLAQKKYALLALPVLAILWLAAQPTVLSGAFCLLAGLAQAFVTRLLLATLECS